MRSTFVQNKVHLTTAFLNKVSYSTKSAEDLHIIYWTMDSTRRWITAALAATKLKNLLTHHISLMHEQIYGAIMHPVGWRSITYAESYRRIFIIVLVDTIHVRQSLEMRLLTSTYSTVINTRKILLILISSSIHPQYSRSKQDHIQQSTLEVLEYRFYRIWSCDAGVYIGMLERFTGQNLACSFETKNAL